MGFVKLETSETRGMGLSFIRIIEFGWGDWKEVWWEIGATKGLLGGLGWIVGILIHIDTLELLTI